MSVDFSHEMRCWTWTCIFGCSDYDYEGQQEATEAFLSHDCVGMKA